MFISVIYKVFHKLTTPTTTTTRRILEKIGFKFNAQWDLFLILLVLFPANIAKHFVIPSAYIRGLLIDYLTPSVYLTDILLLLLLGSAIVDSFKKGSVKLNRLAPFTPLLLLLPSLLTSSGILISTIRFLKLLLWAGFILWVKRNIVWERDKGLIIRFISFGVSWVSILSLIQFLAQRTVLGYWFLGEPVIYPSLGGVAKTSLFGKEILRAYGTFPHPNVLGGVLAVLLCWFIDGGTFWPLVGGLVGLLISFSRLSWVVFVLGLWGLIFKRLKGPWRFEYLAASSVIFLGIALYLFPSGKDLSLIRRVELLENAWTMFLSAPWTGVGLGQFSAKLPLFKLPSGPTLFLQPVHNIFALIASESGFFAFLGFLFLLILAIKNVIAKKRSLLLIALIQLIILGFFDHYLYTLPQGLFLLSLTLGLSFSYSEKDGR